MQIRRFRHADLDGIYAVFLAAVREGASRFYSAEDRQAWAPNDTPFPGWRDRLGDAIAFVAEDEGMICGFASMTRDGHLDFLYVAPAQMGRGVAGQLYDALMAEPELARLPGYDVQASHFSRRFLLKRGWQDAPAATVERFGRALTVFHMRKEAGGAPVQAERRKGVVRRAAAKVRQAAPKA